MYKIAKKDIDGFVKSLLAEHAVYAPVRENDFVLFDEIADPAEIVWDYQQSRQGAYRLFMPQSEVLLRFQTQDGEVELDVPMAEEPPRVVLGLHPCDARALTLLDYVFKTGDYPDPYYINHRDNTTIIALGCAAPAHACFCTTVGGHPFGREGVDILLTDIGDAYLADAVTDKGEELLQKLSLAAAKAADEKKARKVAQDAKAAMSPPIDISGIADKLGTMYESPFWDSVHEKCLGCGVCTYLCPTCYCFDIVDEAVGNQGQRVRNWDSCMFPLYSLEASGHNPRPTQRERWRQRAMHKFKYHIDLYGVPSCVGCGRCVTECPVNLDIREVVANIMDSSGKNVSDKEKQHN